MTLQVDGNPTAEEIAALLAALCGERVGPREDRYERWRRGREHTVSP